MQKVSERACGWNGMDGCGPRLVGPISGVASFRSIPDCSNSVRLKSIEHCGMNWRICLRSFDFANDDAFSRMVASGEMPAAIWASLASMPVTHYR